MLKNYFFAQYFVFEIYEKLLKQVLLLILKFANAIKIKRALHF